MSTNPEGQAPMPDITGWPTFLFIIDGQIADILTVPPAAERKVACLSSNPTIVVLEGGYPAPGGYLPPIDSPWPTS